MDISKLLGEIAEIKRVNGICIVSDMRQPHEIAEISDVYGDEEHILSSNIDKDVVIACTSAAVAEMIKIRYPKKRVLCPYEESEADGEIARLANELMAEHDGFFPICTVGVPTEIASTCNAVLTEDSASQAISEMEACDILLFSSERLGTYIKKRVPRKNIMLARVCHDDEESIDIFDVERIKQSHAAAEVVSAYSCADDVLSISDIVGTYRDIKEHILHSDKKEFIVCADGDFVRHLSYENEGKRFFSPKMKNRYKITLCDIKDIAFGGTL